MEKRGEMENCAYLRKNPGYAPDTTLEEFKNETINSHFGQGNPIIIVKPSFSKSSVFKIFSVSH